MAKPPRRPSRFSRRLGWSLVSVAALLGGAWYALDQYVKGDAIRQMVMQKITEATGRTTTIREPLGLTFSLKPAVKVTGFTLANAEWGSAPAMVTAETVLLRVDLLRLLSREIVVQDLELERPQVLLEVNRAGKGNWQFTPQPKTGAAAKDTETATTTAGDKSFRFVMQSVRITDGQLVWHDMAKDSRKTLTLQSLTLRPEGAGVQADLDGRYQDVPYTVGLSLKALQPLLQQSGEVPFDLTSKIADSTLTASGLVELGTAQKGGVPIRHLTTEMRVNLPTFAALKPFAASAKPLPEFGPVQVRLAVAGTPQKLDLSPVQVQALDSDLAGTFTLRPPLAGQALALDGTLQLKAVSLAKLGAALQQKLADVPLHLSTQLGFANATLRVQDLKLTAGESTLSGAISLDIPKEDKDLPENIRVKIDAPMLRLADFTAPQADADRTTAAGTAKASKAADAPLFSREPLPMDTLRGLNADLAVTIGQLVLPPKGDAPARMFRDVRLDLDADRRTVRLSDFKAALPGSGQLGLSARLDTATQPAQLVYKLTTTGMTLGTFLKEWGVTEDVTGGATRLISEGQTAGVSLHDWAANLSGQTAVVVQKAQVRGGITDVLGGPLVQGVLPGLAQGASSATTVNCVVSRWPTRGGVMTTDLTLVDTSQLTVVGPGAVRLGDETLQMTLVPKAKREALSGLTPPISIRGPLRKPSFRLDEKAVAEDVLQGVLSGRITTGKPLEVLGQVFGPRNASGRTTAVADPCAQVLTASGEIRADGGAPSAATVEEGAAPGSDQQPQSGSLPQKLEERLDKILPGVGGLFGR